MLTEIKYQSGLKSFSKLKYNINPCKKELFDVVVIGFANALLNHQYSELLTDEQRNKLSNLTSN